MEFLSIRERNYQRNNLREVRHVTLDPDGPGVIRIHLIPPRARFWQKLPSVLLLNGQDILPLSFTWTVLLAGLIDELQTVAGRQILADEWDGLVSRTVSLVQKVYPRIPAEIITADLRTIIGVLGDIAAGRPPQAEIGLLSLGEYARFMQAPHRMDLMISSMNKGNGWNCNQQCLHCYAAGQARAGTPELTTAEWLRIIEKCRLAGIPQLTFTGGEPTLRDDLDELVQAASWFVTRLNTNGVLLSEDLCTRLRQASLDSVQITFYSADPAKHNLLVGADTWEMTVAGIQNAVNAGLNVSINTPLCQMNKDYSQTISFLKDMGVRYLSCSGLIPAGQALTGQSTSTQLTPAELTDILQAAQEVCRENKLELAFTSPGWLPEATLRTIGFATVPTCGACLSNMAIAPDGTVVPCQSWLSGAAPGNMLTDSWPAIWNHPTCRDIRLKSAQTEQKCQLSQQNEVKPGGSAR